MVRNQNRIFFQYDTEHDSFTLQWNGTTVEIPIKYSKTFKNSVTEIYFESDNDAIESLRTVRSRREVVYQSRQSGRLRLTTYRHRRLCEGRQSNRNAETVSCLVVMSGTGHDVNCKYANEIGSRAKNNHAHLGDPTHHDKNR